MENKEKESLELVFVLDRSGSMSGLESDTIGGFNSLIAKQDKESLTWVTTFLFNHVSQIIHDRISISKMDKLTDSDYQTFGSTALYDAIGTAIEHVSKIHRYIRKEDVPKRTLFVITTDGFENASHCFTLSKVRKMIEEKKELGWEFMFLGANIDSVETAGSMGIERDCAVDYMCDQVGTHVLYETVADVVRNYSVGKACLSTSDWKVNLEKDLKERRPKKK